MNKVTAVLISFLRPGYTRACVESLQHEYPDIKVIVADNAGDVPAMRKFCADRGVDYYPMPYDSGVCYARNFLVSKVDTEYVLVGDDDFYYDEDARVLDMEIFLNNHREFDLIGGRVRQNGIVRNYQGYVDLRHDHIKITPIDLESEDDSRKQCDASGLRYCFADMTFNYFLARTDKVRSVPWDEKIKVAYEHLSWFVDFKEAGGKVAFSPDPIVIHKPQDVDPKQAPEYIEFRNRQSDRERFFERFQIDYTIQMNGKKDFSPFYVPPAIQRLRFNDTKHVDFCVTTFMRPKALERLLFSIVKFYPMAAIYIADQNATYDRAFYKSLRQRLHDAGLVRRISVDSLPHDCGLSTARNHLVRNTPSKYKLILDDDFVFDQRTDVGQMVKLLDAFPHIGVVGGAVEQLGCPVNFEFYLGVEDGTIRHVPDRNGWRVHDGVKYRKTGCVLNFALMRSEMFGYILWDDALKVSEHTDFYLRMKDVPYGILYAPEVVVQHPPTDRETGYKEMRQRDEFFVAMLRKHGAKRMKYLNGQVVEAMPDGSLKRYKEQPDV